ncbi:MAG: flagellar motor switch protein FliG [Rhizobiales bacterium 65-9]|nr:flagellar motor switch protein FliG [Hyphomicrobiales bacterium]OJY34690.1 MAG: flagellar motor switch protein FliG [Rhizobiales bacterium 65-9]
MLGSSENLDNLSGPQRAAVILLTLGDEFGAPIWKRLDEDEIRVVSVAMSQLGSIEASTVESLIVDFVSKMSATGAVTGSLDRTELLLQKILPGQQASMIMEEIRGPAGRNMWQKLSNVDSEVLANFLKNEYPQTAAVVLSKIKPDHAARVLAAMPEDSATDIVHRMLKLEGVQKDALERIEETLRTEFVSNLSQTTRRDAHELMAEIFNSFDRQTETRFLASLEGVNHDAAKRIRSLMFTFDDLVRLDPASMQTLMRALDKTVLTKALKGASEVVRTFFFSNMSTRASKAMQDDMAALGPMRLKDVDDAQATIVLAAKDLADKGEILISKNRSEDELVY